MKKAKRVCDSLFFHLSFRQVCTDETNSIVWHKIENPITKGTHGFLFFSTSQNKSNTKDSNQKEGQIVNFKSNKGLYTPLPPPAPASSLRVKNKISGPDCSKSG